MDPTVRPYEPATDEATLWRLKQHFERGLGSETGGEEKAQRYEEKLDDAYCRGYLEWVERCLEDEPRAVLVAVVEDTLVGYVFVLPDALAYIWDSAVLNELYVLPEYRGTGVADSLLESALEVVGDQALPLERLVLDVDRENDRAQAFYDRYGFEHWGELVVRSLE